MGDYGKHLRIAKEKLAAVVDACHKKRNTVVGDLATKVVEQLVETYAALNGKHFGAHAERHEYANKNYPREINDAMRRIWFAYGDLGYDGVNGKRAKIVMDNLKIIVEFFSKRFGEEIATDI